MADEQNKTDYLLLGSSHFSERHHFKKQFLEERKDDRIGDITISSVSGGHLTQRSIDFALDFVYQRRHRPLIIIVMLACNAVRQNIPNNRIMQRHARLLECLKNYSHVRVVLCGLIPCPRTDPWTKKTFKDLNLNMKSLASGGASFFNTARFFVHEGQIKTYLFKDGLHLNKEGSHLLVSRLHVFLERMLDH